VVADSDTAVALGSGDLPVLATPRVVALLEEAATDAARPLLRPGQTSVGVMVELHHLAPSPVGAIVEAEATLTTQDARTLEFDVRARCAGTEIARGSHRRAIVDRERFLAHPELGRSGT
jgi:predicted thioesterase